MIDILLKIIEKNLCSLKIISIYLLEAKGKLFIAVLLDGKIKKSIIKFLENDLKSKTSKEIKVFNFIDLLTVIQNEFLERGVLILDKNIFERQKIELRVMKEYFELKEFRKEIYIKQKQSLDEELNSRM
ncbi:MAG: hypothetical protein ACRCZO_17400 [Cetobacterium sp.]